MFEEPLAYFLNLGYSGQIINGQRISYKILTKLVFGQTENNF